MTPAPAPVLSGHMSPQEKIIDTTRSRSQQGSPKARKRLTLHFPILSPNSPSERQFTRSPTPPRPTSRQGSPGTPSSDGSPTDSTSFLTTLAAQERRVLELKEELSKAEVELSRLKRQWAQYEAGRKKDEMHQIERMRPLTAHSMHYEGVDENAGMTPAAALKASLENGTDRPFARKSTQRVFSGSRHTRALSLLSPNAYGSRFPRSPPREGVTSPTIPATRGHAKPGSEARLSTMSLGEHETSFSRTYRMLAGPMSVPPPARDVFMNNGKKMASDFRAGLFTFWEDIRQATVGDEGVNGTETRISHKRSAVKPGSSPSQNHKPSKKNGNLSERRGTSTPKLQTTALTPDGRPTMSPGAEGDDRSFWNEFDLETPATKEPEKNVLKDRPARPKSEMKPTVVDVDDNWDIWDSPVPSKGSPETTRTRSDKKRKPATGDGLPWPELKKLNPARLSRTVSDLVKDWDAPAVASNTAPAGLDDQAVASPHI